MKEISELERSFGGVSRTNLIGRPMINRNKSFVEFGDTKTAPSADFFRKENNSQAQMDAINRATRRQ